VNKNIPKILQIKLTLSSYKPSPRIYNNSSGFTTNNSILIEDDDDN
jgi:hypothetical protein